MPILSGAKSICLESVCSTTLSKANNVLAYRSRRCTIGKACQLSKGEGHSNFKTNQEHIKLSQLKALCSSLETGNRVISIHDSLLIFSSFPRILQHCFPFFLPPLTQVFQVQIDLSLEPFSNQSHHLMAGVVLITIRVQSLFSSEAILDPGLMMTHWPRGWLRRVFCPSVEETSRLCLKKIRVSGIIRSHFSF